MIAVVGRIAALGLAKTDVTGRTPHGAALESAPGGGVPGVPEGVDDVGYIRHASSSNIGRCCRIEAERSVRLQ